MLELTIPSPTQLVLDSRQVTPGSTFLAFPGTHSDGRAFIPAALALGAGAVLWDPADDFMWNPAWFVPNQAVPDLREQVGYMAAQYYQQPSSAMNTIGVTGTNGKTSITQWLAQAYSLLGIRSAVLGTVGNGLYGAVCASSHTTLDPIALQHTLASYRDAGAKVVAMEVSSHGLAQGRVNGVTFNSAVFTNLTRDHLDYHGSMEAYGAVKARLFQWDGLQHAVINVDDPFGVYLAEYTAAQSVLRYGLNGGDVFARTVHASLAGLILDVVTPWGEARIKSSLLGHFNAANLLACLTVLCAHGVPLARAAEVLGQIDAAPGRMQCVGGGTQPLVVIDYAHTPDALEKALSTLAEIKPAGGRLFCVFGCGGDRDRGKRPLMGAIAARLADICVLTSDNPRSEVPTQIMDDIRVGIPQSCVLEVDRRQAILRAISAAEPRDVVLIAGKGHENYQESQGVKQAFSDVLEAQTALSNWKQPT